VLNKVHCLCYKCASKTSSATTSSRYSNECRHHDDAAMSVAIIPVLQLPKSNSTRCAIYCGQGLDGGARVFAGTRCLRAQSESAARATRVAPRRANEPRCSFPHDLRRCTASCSARACRLRSAPHLLLSPSATAECLRAFCSTTRCWG
jgi:hypothetical protein